MSYTEPARHPVLNPVLKDYVAPKLSITDVRITTLKDNNAIMGKDGFYRRFVAPKCRVLVQPQSPSQRIVSQI